MRGILWLVIGAVVALQPAANGASARPDAADAAGLMGGARFSVREHVVTLRLGEASARAREILRELRREDRALVENLLLSADGRRDDLERAAKTLRELARYGDEVRHHRSLAVAVALVHDRGTRLVRDVNGVVTKSPRAGELFAYFCRWVDAGEMSDALPPELLAYVVDATASVDQLRWAAKAYAAGGWDAYGETPYDQGYVDGGRRAMAGRPYTLANVRAYGGVCADRTHFATSVSKAAGAPSAVVRGIRPEVTHAWAALLDVETGQWREAGRSSRYRRLSGRIVSPQTGATISDDELRALGQLVHVREEDRLEALALAHWARMDRGNWQWKLRAALELNEGCLPAWEELGRRASELTDEENRQWRMMAQRLCAGGMAVRVQMRLAGAIRDGGERRAVYERLYEMTRGNDDLACELRYRQAVEVAAAGELSRAMEMCAEAAVKHRTSGEGMLLLARTAREISRRAGTRDTLLAVYRAMIDGMPRPRTMAEQFTGHTAWKLINDEYERARGEM